MYDAPFHVERIVKPKNGDYDQRATYAIARTGEGELCWTDDVTLAYRLVELLNDEVNGTDINR